MKLGVAASWGNCERNIGEASRVVGGSDGSDGADVYAVENG